MWHLLVATRLGLEDMRPNRSLFFYRNECFPQNVSIVWLCDQKRKKLFIGWYHGWKFDVWWTCYRWRLKDKRHILERRFCHKWRVKRCFFENDSFPESWNRWTFSNPTYIETVACGISEDSKRRKSSQSSRIRNATSYLFSKQPVRVNLATFEICFWQFCTLSLHIAGVSHTCYRCRLHLIGSGCLDWHRPFEDGLTVFGTKQFEHDPMEMLSSRKHLKNNDYGNQTLKSLNS